MKRIVLLFLIILPMLASADAIEIGGICYNLAKETKEAEVASNPNKYSGSIIIPKSVEYEGVTYSVTKIGYSAFASCASLTSIEIPNSVTNIGQLAFDGCSGLTSITIPNSVTNIDAWAFSGCSGLTSVDIPSSVTKIGSRVFQDCSNLTSITIPNSVTSIGSYAFWRCTSLPSIIIPNSVTSIGENTFEYCYSLASVTIPNSVTKIGGFAFHGCSKIASITIPNSVTDICERAFLDCTGLTSITIPNSVKNIEIEAFGVCNALTSVTIGTGVNIMGSHAFHYCDNITSVHISDLESWCKIHFIDSASNPLYYAHHLILNGVEIKDLVIPNSVTSILANSFYRCSNLTSVTIPDGVTSIGENAFAYCSGLTSITIPNNVTNIGNQAFYNCYGVTSVIIGSKVESLGINALGGCQKLLDIYCYAENVPKTQKSTFRNTNIEEVTLHVPAASVSAYQTVEPWKNFKQIAALTDLEEYHSLLEEGKVWQYSYNNGVRQYMKSLTIDGDTIIGNQTYKKIIDVASQGIEMFLREEGKKVYCCYPNRETEILLYDFGKNAGEIISRETRNGDTWIQKVVAVDTIMVKDNSFRCVTVHEYGIPEGMSEETYFAGNYGYESGFWVEGIGSFTYLDSPISYPGNYYSFYECQIGDVTYKQKDFLDAIKNNTQPAYRPFVEEGKVWKVGAVGSGNPVQLVDYYYFDGDTIINGKTCKQMMCQRYVTPDFAESNYISQDPPSCYVGAWYEEDKKVYFCNTTDEQFKLMYDFSMNAYDTLQIDNHPYYLYVVGPRQTGGIRGFKGVFREVRECGEEGITYQCAPWLEGVGIVYGPPTLNVLNVELADPMWFLMSCSVGDEVIYLNDGYVDGEIPAGARKRFDFSHTIKTKPKARNRSGENQSLYGEYDDQQLGINLDPLDDAYLVSITDDTGKVVYEKSVNAGNIVGLNIDISAYAKGRYTVTMENSDEIFTGEFDAQTTGIRDVRCKKEDGRSIIYNLQGQRLHSLQKGLNIVNGQKVFVK